MFYNMSMQMWEHYLAHNLFHKGFNVNHKMKYSKSTDLSKRLLKLSTEYKQHVYSQIPWWYRR